LNQRRSWIREIDIMMPNPVRLFHITAIGNLSAICLSGALVSKNSSAQNSISYQNIAHGGAQGARSNKSIPNPPGGGLHDFVPFYFAPRSPMLFAINNGRVAGCNYRQADILHFETTVAHVQQYTQDIVFYDRNATLMFSAAYTDLRLLPKKVDWSLITEQPTLDGFCKYFQSNPNNQRYVDRMEKRQAEFLVKTRVSLNQMTRIGVCSEQKATLVRSILVQHGMNITVEVKTDWYFLGQ